ncbi:secreted arabinase [Crepidotus variabilis]|uniref:Arabinan endo-1,5-alpha-L-arabinosidase n=1 Tax=Crepidotus variabilis TaxID=179855 RepID=A0A9P6ESA6_9AGAR|nr:secreted arabinase [Crepidotus variabilis]
MHWPSLTAALLTLVTSVHAVVGPGVVTGDTSIHDPTLCKDNAGTYYLLGTAAGIDIKTSKDRTNWTYLGKMFPNGASWTDKYTGKANGDIWAPDCTYINGVFWVYYSASSFGSQNSAVFLSKSTTGQPGSWSNEGLIISTTSSNDYNAIDPNLFIDGSNWYLSLGSWWTGIKLLSLNPSTGKASSTSLTSLASHNNGIEASNIFKYGSYYYLFTSWDQCCNGVSSTYNIRVGRSSKVNGPYVDKSGVALTSAGGTLLLGTHDKIYGPGGQDLMTDGDGPILIYHYYTTGLPQLGINRLDFSSGWPYAYRSLCEANISYPAP